VKSLQYDPQADFSSIGFTQEAYFTLVASKKIPIRSLDELVAFARKHPGALNVAVANPTGALTAAVLRSVMSLHVVEIPFPGELHAIQELVAGRVHVFAGTGSTIIPQVQAETVTIIGKVGRDSPLFPEAPMLRTAVPEFEYMTSWGALFGPRGLADETRKKYFDALQETLRDANVKESMRRIGLSARLGPPESVSERILTELPVLTAFIRKTGIKLIAD
jgi:tripartite-type tricarboxylate transporter receptor subunit TctC